MNSIESAFDRIELKSAVVNPPGMVCEGASFYFIQTLDCFSFRGGLRIRHISVQNQSVVRPNRGGPIGVRSRQPADGRTGIELDPSEPRLIG